MATKMLKFVDLAEHRPEKRDAGDRRADFGEIYQEYDHDAASAQALPRVSGLQTEGILVEVEGGGRMLIGVAAISDDQSVFVKLTGPVDAVRGEREAFLTFCQGLRWDG